MVLYFFGNHRSSSVLFLNILMNPISFICCISSGIIWIIWKHWRRTRRLMTYIILLWARLISTPTNFYQYKLKLGCTTSKLLFLQVNLREPSIITKNWLYGSTFITTPLLFHLCGSVPLWFCSSHLLPTYKDCNFRALCSVPLSSSIALYKYCWEWNSKIPSLLTPWLALA